LLTKLYTQKEEGVGLLLKVENMVIPAPKLGK